MQISKSPGSAGILSSQILDAVVGPVSGACTRLDGMESLPGSSVKSRPGQLGNLAWFWPVSVTNQKVSFGDLQLTVVG